MVSEEPPSGPRRRVQVSLSPEQLRILEAFRGEMGQNYSEIVRNIALAWLAEKSFVSDAAKRKLRDQTPAHR